MTTHTARSGPIAERYRDGHECPVCGSGSKGCSRTEDGLHFCRGEPADPTAWVRTGGNGEFDYHRLGNTEDRPQKATGRKTKVVSKPAPPAPRPDATGRRVCDGPDLQLGDRPLPPLGPARRVPP